MIKKEKVYIVISLPGNLQDAQAKLFKSEDGAKRYARESEPMAAVRWVSKDLAKRIQQCKREPVVYGWLLSLLVWGALKESGYQGSRYEHLPRDWSGYNSERNAYSKNE